MPSHLARQRQDTVLRVLREAGERPVGLPELRELGIANPAAVIYELELAGYDIDRVHSHGRLIGVRLGRSAQPRPEPGRRRRFRR